MPKVAGAAPFSGLGGKVVCITGAASGIGLAMADAFAALGAQLALLDIDSDGLDVAGRRLRQSYPGVQLHTWTCAVQDEAQVERVFGELHAQWSRIDALVNSAGIGMNAPTLSLSGNAWRLAIDVNLSGTFYCARAAGRHMVASGGGVILNIASMYGVVAAPERAAYCASKAGVVMLTKSLAAEWGPLGVRVNAIAPGYIRTHLVDELVDQGRLDIQSLQAHTPLKRLGTPEEIAALGLFLVSEHAAFINGHIAAADGGWTANGYF